MKRLLPLILLFLLIPLNAYAIRDKIRFIDGGDVASSAQLILREGNSFDVTGTTTITSIAHKETGAIILLEFDGILTLTHSTSLVLPTGANITTAAGDIAVFYEYETNVWRCFNYMRADGTLVGSGVDMGWTVEQTFNAGLNTKNGDTSAGYVDFFEDSDNGSNYVRVIGPASTADVTLTLPSATDTLVGKDTTDTLTNKTLTSPTIGTSALITNGSDVRVSTTTSAHEWSIQIYDNDTGPAWLDALNFANGNTPTITLGSGVTLAGLGALSLSSIDDYQVSGTSLNDMDIAFTVSQSIGTTGFFSNVTTLSTSQVNNLRASPITLVAAQGTNTIIEFVSAVITYDYATGAFTVGADEDLVIEYADGTDVSGSIETAGFLDQADDEVRYVPSSLAVNADLEPAINQGLRIFNTGTGETADGGGEVDVRVTYRVYSTGF